MIPTPLGDGVPTWVGCAGLLAGAGLWLLVGTLAMRDAATSATAAFHGGFARRTAPAHAKAMPTPNATISTPPEATRPATADGVRSCAPTLELGFDGGSSEIGEPDPPGLDALVAWAGAHPEARLVLEAFASADGGPDENLALSHARGQAARRLLRDRGIAMARMQVQAFGEYRSMDEQSVTHDRRVVVRVDGMPTCVPERNP